MCMMRYGWSEYIKPAYTHKDALEELEQGIEKHFDPDLAFCFFEKRDAMKSVFEDLSDR